MIADKIDGAALDGVAATCLWTLRNRAEESMRPGSAFHDPLAERLCRRIDYDYERFGKPSQSHPLRRRAHAAARSPARPPSPPRPRQQRERLHELHLINPATCQEEAVATPSDAVTRAHALIRAGQVGEAAEVLRVAADERGDVPADRELGRLLALRRHQAVFNLGERWEAEERLIRSGGGDPAAACALINLYAMAADEIRQDPWEETARLAHCRTRAAELYGRALAAAPPNRTVAGAMVAFLYNEWNWHQDQDPEEDEDASRRLLNELTSVAERALELDPDDMVAAMVLAETSSAQPMASPVSTGGYFAFSLVALGEKHGDQFGEFEETVIASSPVDLLWAVPGMTCLDAELDAEPGRLAIHRPTRPAELLTQPDGADLLSWLREVVAELPEPVMPAGQPVVSGSVVERYGYNATGTDR